MLKCYVDGNLLANEPQGLKDASIQIIRNSTFQGLTSSFISDLQFWGDGYSILKAIAELNAPCASISVVIEDDCDVNPIFDGIVYAGDIEFDEEKCIAVCTIEDDTLASIIIRNRELKVRFGQSESVNGTAITPYNGSSINMGFASRFGFNILDSMQYLFDYITDGQITVNGGTLFSAGMHPNVYTVTCVRTPATTGTIELQYTDIYGQQQNPTRAIGAGVITDTDYAIQVAQSIMTSLLSLSEFGNKAYSVTQAAGVLTVSFFHQANLSVVTTDGTGTINVVQTQAATYGVNNVFFTNGAMLKSTSPVVGLMIASISDLEAILAIYNLQIVYRKTISGYEASVLKIDETYNSATSITISDINQITTSYNAPIAFSVLEFSQAGRGSNTGSGSASYRVDFPLYETDSYSGLICGQFNVSAKTTFSYLAARAITNRNELDDEEMFLFEANAGVLVTYNVRVDDPTVTVFSTIHFASGIHPFVAKNYVFQIPNRLVNDGNEIQNNFAIKILKQSNFTHPISRTDIYALLAAPEKRIVFNGRFGYISNVEYNIKTGMTTFELYTE